MSAAHAFASELQERHEDVELTITESGDAALMPDTFTGTVLVFAPSDHIGAVARSAHANSRRILVNGDGKIPDKSARMALKTFDEIWCQSQSAEVAYRIAGLNPAQIKTTGPIGKIPQVPSCNEAELEELIEQLAARPVWLALHPDSAEIEAILEAHRDALRTAPRALLVILPEVDENIDPLIETLHSGGWQSASQLDLENPTVVTEVLVADPETDLGLWCRLATVTFLGGTYVSKPNVDPMGPVALGSAVICGPRHGPFSLTVDELVKVNGMRLVANFEGLSRAVTDLIVPHWAAELAHNAWSVVTEGAEATDALIELIETRLPETRAP